MSFRPYGMPHVTSHAPGNEGAVDNRDPKSPKRDVFRVVRRVRAARRGNLCRLGDSSRGKLKQMYVQPS